MFYTDLMDVLQEDKVSHYPPYNVFETDEGAGIEIAVTGLAKDDLEVYFDEDKYLVVQGTYGQSGDKEYTHKGLSTKDFKRKFQLAKHYGVESVEVLNGLMSIKLKKIEPEKKMIPIQTPSKPVTFKTDTNTNADTDNKFND